MTDHVSKKFPDHTELIQSLMETNSAFRDICADYEEISTWLICCTRTKGISPKEYDHALEVKKDLENDIQQKLMKEVS